MYVHQVQLKQYRNYRQLSLELKNQITILTGQNGSGKSNILESIFLACIGKSFRTNKENDLIQWDNADYYVQIVVERNEGPSKIEIRYKKNQIKEIFINGFKAQRIGELMGVLNCILFSPEDLKIIKGGPVERRRYLDIELSQIDKPYFYHLQRYHRIIKQRNKLLKQSKYDSHLKDVIPIWNEKLADEGSHIIEKRSELIKQIAQTSQRIHYQLSNEKEELNVEYIPSVINTGNVQETRQVMIELLNSKIDEDIEKGTTSRGCHRDDFMMTINHKEAKVFGSQGQQRTAILAMKLAEIERMKKITKETPVLLLDDVMSELDDHRKKYLIEMVKNVQTIITTTELSDVYLEEKQSYQNFHITNGIIQKNGK